MSWLQETLDLLILRTLPAGPAHGHAIVKAIERNNRRAKDYRLTLAGRKQLIVETTRWEKLARAIAGILRPGSEGGRP